MHVIIKLVLEGKETKINKKPNDSWLSWTSTTPWGLTRMVCQGLYVFMTILETCHTSSIFPANPSSNGIQKLLKTNLRKIKNLIKGAFTSH